jgi:hypothetical protein
MRLLLDSHVAKALAEQLRAHGIDAAALPEWKGGNYRTADDEDLLPTAYIDRRILVTFDCQTIPPLIKRIAEAGEYHGGVILVSSRSFRANDIGGLLHALLTLAVQRGSEDWADRVIYLQS